MSVFDTRAVHSHTMVTSLILCGIFNKSFRALFQTGACNVPAAIYVSTKNTCMNRLLFFSLLLLAGMISCKKDPEAVSYPAYSYYGQWQWTRTIAGAYVTTPSPDSVIVMTLSTGNRYQVSLNGKSFELGTFQIDSSSNSVILQFNNITQPAGTTTRVTTGNMTELLFNYFRIGQFVLFQYNSTRSPGDTLQFIREPGTPEDPVSYFKRIPGTP